MIEQLVRCDRCSSSHGIDGRLELGGEIHAVSLLGCAEVHLCPPCAEKEAALLGKTIWASMINVRVRKAGGGPEVAIGIAKGAVTAAMSPPVEVAEAPFLFLAE